MQWIRQRMRSCAYGRVLLPEPVTLENGNLEVRQVDQSSFRLPDKSTTDLSALIEAGVDLKRVDSAVYGYGRGVVSTENPEETQTSEDKKE